MAGGAEFKEQNSPAAEAKVEKTSDTPHSIKSGWDGKLRVDRRAVLTNPEALSDPEYSDDDAHPVEQIEADEDLLDDENSDTEEIDCLHSRISSLPKLRLERFRRLRRLCLRQNLIQHIELPDIFAGTLEDLELYDNLIKHIEGLEAFTELRSLDISYNKLKHIKNLAQLTKLDHLYLVQNRITHIENLDKLTSLVYLELGANRIRKVENLDSLVNLQQLWLGGNKITSLEGLKSLTNLRILSVQANRLTTLQGLDKLVNLTDLYISDNQIKQLDALKSNPLLKILDFQNNPITLLNGLETLTELENVWASNCQLASFNELERVLSDKNSLEEVYFEGNPIQKQNPVLYRNKVRLALPQVIKIDASYVKVT